MANKLTGFARRQQRVRHKLRKNANGKPRLSVHRTSKHIYVQLIDDQQAQTLAAASTLDKHLGDVKSTTVDAAHKVGSLIAERAKEVNIEHAVFDRGGYIFHGRVKAVVEGARDAGLKI